MLHICRSAPPAELVADLPHNSHGCISQRVRAQSTVQQTQCLTSIAAQGLSAILVQSCGLQLESCNRVMHASCTCWLGARQDSAKSFEEHPAQAAVQGTTCCWLCACYLAHQSRDLAAWYLCAAVLHASPHSCGPRTEKPTCSCSAWKAWRTGNSRSNSTTLPLSGISSYAVWVSRNSFILLQSTCSSCQMGMLIKLMR